ncbi:MAG: hypothetical protein ABIQ89_03210 [Candidatus Saccharimonadales bacterium]
MSKESWVGFPDVADKTGGEIFVGHTGLPVGVDPESLQLNADALRRAVIGWGGYESLTLAGYSGEADEVTFGVSGVDASGVGHAVGAAAITKAQSSDYTSASDHMKNMFNARNGTLSVRWNIDALNSRIETHERYDPNIRARQFQKEIRKNTIQGVVDHSVFDDWRTAKGAMTKSPTIFIDGQWMHALTADFMDQDYTGVATNVGLRLVFMQTAIKLVWSIGAYADFRTDMIMDPLFTVARPTRAAIATGILASHKLVRATPTTATQKDQ